MEVEGLGGPSRMILHGKAKRLLLVVSRTESKLKAATEEIGATGYYVLDTGSITDVVPFVSRTTSDHPELDCLPRYL
ncbi:uncharacterized protein F4812DRAFT_440723 [Daldinia caldariorum]|uniref:uncharacterized protein n=1 Tax=Daldinia caldariorum TaxID=326644 RepID=UPI0020081C55|nr:uncharacterized protein F4812DRAFT_440723 [Daldinia caldariorum]KAI1464861.1 hypothetical protein F4812DRAFT_440723 [Daldinia caldariorum]